MLHSAEFRRCLVEIDVQGIRALWHHVSPHLPQPQSDYEAMVGIHLARVQAASIPEALKEYSKQWLAERTTGRVAAAVGISVRTLNNQQNARTQSMEHEMSESVLLAVRDGVDLVAEASEVTRRMNRAKARA